MKDIKQLLNKGKLTGAEVGKLLIKNYINDIIQQGQGNADYKPLFSEQEFSKLVDGLETDRQRTIFNIYFYIYHFMINGFNRSQAFRQQFYHGLNRYIGFLENFQREIEKTKRLEKTPLIVTKKQYKKILAEGLEKVRKHEPSLFEVVQNILGYYIDEYAEERAENIPQEILAAFAEAEAQPADPADCTEDTRESTTIFVLPDGRTSEELESEAWKLAFLKAMAEKRGAKQADTVEELSKNVKDATDHLLETVRAIAYNGIQWYIDNGNLTEQQKQEIEPLNEVEEQTLAEALTMLEFSVKYDIDKLVYSNNSYECLLMHEALAEYETSYNALIKLLKLDRVATANKKYIGEETPLTKYDILLDICVFTLSRGKEGLDKLQRNAPAVYEYIINTLKTSFKDIDTENNGCIATYGELADNGIIGYDEYKKANSLNTNYLIEAAFEDDNFNINPLLLKRIRAGVAVIDNEKDEYIDFFDEFVLCLYNFIAEGDNMEQALATQTRLINPALSYLYSYNALLDILNTVFDIDISIVKIDIEHIEKQAKAFNNILYATYFEIPGEEENRKQLRELFKRIFKPIPLEDTKPTAEAIEELTDRIDKIKAADEAKRLFKDKMDSLILELEKTAKTSSNTYNKDKYGV